MNSKSILNESLVRDCVDILKYGSPRISAPFLPAYKLASMHRKSHWEPVVLDLFKHGTKELPEEKGIAFLWKDSEYLYACEDSDVYNSAKEKNEKTWETGDVMELFFQAPGREEYYELHLTPGDATLELRIPGAENLGKVPFESQFYQSGFSAYARNFDHPDCKGWLGLMTIPFEGLGIADGKLHKSRFSVCRHNFNKKWTKPEISSTTIFLEGGFHQPHLWHEIEQDIIKLKRRSDSQKAGEYLNKSEALKN